MNRSMTSPESRAASSRGTRQRAFAFGLAFPFGGGDDDYGGFAVAGDGLGAGGFGLLMSSLKWDLASATVQWCVAGGGVIVRVIGAPCKMTFLVIMVIIVIIGRGGYTPVVF